MWLNEQRELILPLCSLADERAAPVSVCNDVPKRRVRLAVNIIEKYRFVASAVDDSRREVVRVGETLRQQRARIYELASAVRQQQGIMAPRPWRLIQPLSLRRRSNFNNQWFDTARLLMGSCVAPLFPRGRGLDTHQHKYHPLLAFKLGKPQRRGLWLHRQKPQRLTFLSELTIASADGPSPSY